MRPSPAPACAGLLLLTATAIPAAAQPLGATASPGTVGGQRLEPLPFRRGEIAVHVRVHPFPDFTARVAADSAAFSGDSLAGARGMAVAPLAGIRTGIGLLDGRVRRTLGAPEYSQIRFELLRVAPRDGPPGDTIPVTLYGRFTIRGVARDDTIPGVVVLAPGSLAAAASFPLDVRAFGIKPPTAFFGLLRADPVVQVSVRLEFGSRGGEAGAAERRAVESVHHLAELRLQVRHQRLERARASQGSTPPRHQPESRAVAPFSRGPGAP